MRPFHDILVSLSLLCLTGCSSTVLDLRDNLDLHRLSFRERLAPDHDLIQQFLTCTTQISIEKIEPIGLQATGSLGSVRSLIAHLRERQPQQADSLLALQVVINDLADTARRRISLDPLQTAVEAVRRWHLHLDFHEGDLAQDPSRFAQLLLAYNSAYFGNLRFIGEPTEAAAGRQGVMKVTSNGFVDRSGNAWRYPGLSADTPQLNRTGHEFAAAVNSQRLSADLTRIFLEAFFDAAFQVPAVRSATALQVKWRGRTQPYPEFDAQHPAIPLESLAQLTREAMRAEAAVTAAVGKAVRGGGLFGLQNETVAASLETAAGVMAKKLVEHEGFCYFQVTQSKPLTGEVSEILSDSASLSGLPRRE